MFCSKCGNKILEGANFCSACGAPIAEEPVFVEIKEDKPTSSEIRPKTEEATPVQPQFDEIQWNVAEFPDGSSNGKTDDIDFDWNADPKDIRDRYTRGLDVMEKAEVNAKADLNVEDIMPTPVSEPEIDVEMITPKYEEMSASDKIDKFYTFSSKNEEFQKLLNKEYGKIRSGNPIQQEKTEAEAAAEKKFEERTLDPSMDAFFEREGIVKPYEPKAFESDVLQRIEAQERAKEDARLEEEARQKAIEEARLAAEEEMRAEEKERLIAEEKAKLEAEKKARERELEEAREKAAEEARQRAAEEARLAAEEARRVEEEARLAEEREAIIRAENEAKIRGEQQAAMLKAEAELKAQQEAAKIRAQQEARRAKVEEERHMAEMERRRREEAEMRERLEHKQESLNHQIDSAATAEEVRKVLAQTARMREEEAAKIRAAVAEFKGEDLSAGTVSETAQEPVSTFIADAARKPVREPNAVSEFITPQTYEKAQESEPVPAVPVEPVELKEEIPPEEMANIRAHEETQSHLSNMAKARQEFMAEFGFGDETVSEPAPEPVLEPAPEKRHTPVTMEELLGERPVTGRNTMHSEAGDMTATRVVDKAAVLAGMESTMRISKEDLKKQEEERKAEETMPIQTEPEPATVEDLLQQFDEKNSEEKPLELDDLIQEGFAPKEEPSVEPVSEMAEEKKPGLDNTMVMPENLTESVPGDFDSYGKKEAEDFRRRQEAEAAMDNFYNEHEAAAADVPSIEQEPAEEEPEKKGGAGRVVLKVLLIVLIIIFALELAGIAIKFAAPNSGAAHFIDDQLNNVIQMITGDKTYPVEGTDYEV